RLAEADVWRVVAADHAARAFLGDLGARARRLLVQQRALPAVVLRMAAGGLEAAFRIGRRTAALDRARGRQGIVGGWIHIVHGDSVPRPRLIQSDVLAPSRLAPPGEGRGALALAPKISILARRSSPPHPYPLPRQVGGEGAGRATTW